MKRKPALVIILCILAAAAYIAMEKHKFHADRQEAVTVYADHGMGMSLYAEFAKKLPNTEVTAYRRPFLYKEDLKKFNAIGIHSPRFSLSMKEAKILQEYLAEGGIIILTAHTEQTLQSFKNLVLTLKVPDFIKTIDNTKYTDFKTQEVSSTSLNDLLAEGNKLEFYSPIIFADTVCQGAEMSCFAKSLTVGKGTLYLFLGLPPHSNALFTKSQNRNFAFALSRKAPKYLIDEYHHFFPSKTWADLIFDWRYSLPLLGMILGSILFFSLAQNPYVVQTPRHRSAKGYHDISEQLVRQQLSDVEMIKSANEVYRDYLLLKFPNWEFEINNRPKNIGSKTTGSNIKTADVIELALKETWAFIYLHKKIIKIHRGERTHDLHTTVSQANSRENRRPASGRV